MSLKRNFRASFKAGSYRALDSHAHVRVVRKARLHESVEPEFTEWLEKRMMSTEGESVAHWEEHRFAVPEPLSIGRIVR